MSEITLYPGEVWAADIISGEYEGHSSTSSFVEWLSKQNGHVHDLLEKLVKKYSSGKYSWLEEKRDHLHKELEETFHELAIEKTVDLLADCVSNNPISGDGSGNANVSYSNGSFNHDPQTCSCANCTLERVYRTPPRQELPMWARRPTRVEAPAVASPTPTVVRTLFPEDEDEDEVWGLPVASSEDEEDDGIPSWFGGTEEELSEIIQHVETENESTLINITLDVSGSTVHSQNTQVEGIDSPRSTAIELTECERCGNLWDGNAQCLCWQEAGYDDEEFGEDAETYAGEYENEELPEDNSEKMKEIKEKVKEIGENIFDVKDKLSEGEYLKLMDLLQGVVNVANS
jgi:hypothetical protein